MHHQSHSAAQEHIRRSLCPTLQLLQPNKSPLSTQSRKSDCVLFAGCTYAAKAARVLWLPVADFSSLCNTEVSLPHLSCRRLWFFFQCILRSVRDIQEMKQSFMSYYKPAATSLSQCVSGFSTQTHNSVRPNTTLTNAGPTITVSTLKAIIFRQKDAPIHLMAHLIFWSFIPRVQLERKRQASEVEMEQLLCSIVNCTQGKEKRKALW